MLSSYFKPLRKELIRSFTLVRNLLSKSDFLETSCTQYQDKSKGRNVLRHFQEKMRDWVRKDRRKGLMNNYFLKQKLYCTFKEESTIKKIKPLWKYGKISLKGTDVWKAVSEYRRHWHRDVGFYRAATMHHIPKRALGQVGDVWHGGKGDPATSPWDKEGVGRRTWHMSCDNSRAQSTSFCEANYRLS